MGAKQSKNRVKRSALNVDRLQQWMTLLREDIKENIPIIYLAIPGSHNSMTFKINRHSQLAPDADKTIRRIHRFLPWVISRWAKTQNYSVTEQLNYGIRFFDLRISKLETNIIELVNTKQAGFDIYYFVHALYSGSVEDALNEINDFLDQNPGEIVILDFQHFYDINRADHEELYRLIRRIFTNKIYGPQDGQLSNLTLAQAQKMQKQLIIIYRGTYASPEYWPGYCWPTPWPRTCNLDALKNFLSTTLQNRGQDYGWVSQCLITPDGHYIAKSLIHTLAYAARQVMKSLSEWIEEQAPGPWDGEGDARVNVIIADFVDLKNSLFTTMVIDLNDKIPIPGIDNFEEKNSKDNELLEEIHEISQL